MALIVRIRAQTESKNLINMNKKLTYTAPTAETFVVQTEGMICLSAPALLLNGTGGNGFDESADVVEGSSSIFW